MVEILFIVMQAWLYCIDSITRVGTGSVLHCTFIVQLVTPLVYSKLSQSQRCVVTHKTIWQSRYCELAALFTQNNEQLSSVNYNLDIKTKIRVFSIKKWWACSFQVMCTTPEPSSYSHKASCLYADLGQVCHNIENNCSSLLFVCRPHDSVNQ